MTKRQLTILLFLLAIPFVLLLLTRVDAPRGLIWFSLDQLYYYPIGWIGAPLFPADSETAFQVTVGGRLLAFVIYGSVIVALTKWLARRKQP
jgi:hypothetical protein